MSDIDQQLEVALSSSRPELIRHLIQFVCAGNVLNPRQQRTVLAKLAESIERIATMEARWRDLIHIVDSSAQLAKQAVAHEERVLELTRRDRMPSKRCVKCGWFIENPQLTGPERCERCADPE